MAYTNGNGNGAAATALTTATNEQVQDFWTRYEHLKYQDVMKNVLLEEIITRYQNLVNTHATYVQQHEAERAEAQQALEREKAAQRNCTQLQHIMNREPYIMVLIDGDGMIFNNIRDGEAGGKTAAAVIHKAVQEWCAEAVADCPNDAKIVVRIYANLRGLADACYKARLIPSPAHLEEFARGFTRGKTLFDFIDVGYGKDRADGKIAENFKLYVYDYHCRHVLFGCSHDNGYARLLEEYTESPEVLSRVTLLEGTPFEKELAVLPYPTKKFPGIFRESKIITGPVDLLTGNAISRGYGAPDMEPKSRNGSGLNAASMAFMPGNTTPFSSSYSPMGSSFQFDGLQSDQRMQHLRKTSMASSDNTSDSGIGSWATVTKKAAANPTRDVESITIASARVSPSRISRNKQGQRVDEPMNYDRDEVQRLKKIKLCNQHYIGQGCCHYNAGKEDKCPHNHTKKLTTHERYTLRVVARETPCKKGMYCDDVKCIYGHHCPFPRVTEGGMRGSGQCLNGENCRFSREMHHGNTTAVKSIRATGAF